MKKLSIYITSCQNISFQCNYNAWEVISVLTTDVLLIWCICEIYKHLILDLHCKLASLKFIECYWEKLGNNILHWKKLCYLFWENKSSYMYLPRNFQTLYSSILIDFIYAVGLSFLNVLFEGIRLWPLV